MMGSMSRVPTAGSRRLPGAGMRLGAFGGSRLGSTRPALAFNRGDRWLLVNMRRGMW